MNNILSKLSLFAGICLLAVGTNQAYSQSCDMGYGGNAGYSYGSGGYFDSCSPSSSPSGYSYYGGNHFDSHFNYGSYNDSRCDEIYYTPRRNRGYSRPNYTVSNQFGWESPDYVGDAGANYSSGRSIGERLSYIETILAFIVNILGLDTDSNGPSADSGYLSPKSHRQAPGDCAGGT